MISRHERAKKIDKEVGKMLQVISEADTDAIEDTAHYHNLSLVFLREIMINSAIIADKLTDKNTKRKVGDLGDEDKPEEINT